jgi:hypothetical protein
MADEIPGPEGISSHLWMPGEPAGSLEDRVADAAVGAQEKRWARATAIMKFARQRDGTALPNAVLAHEKLASDIGQLLGLSVNEVYLAQVGHTWGELEGNWASVHCLVPEPFQRLEELPGGGADILSGADRNHLANDSEVRALPLFDAFIMNTDRHAGNILVSGGREQGSSWIYFIDHGFAFGGVVPEQQLAAETERKKLGPYIAARSPLRSFLDGLTDENRGDVLPLAKKITDLPEGDLKRLVDGLPDEVASQPVKRFLRRVLRDHVNIVREELE